MYDDGYIDSVLLSSIGLGLVMASFFAVVVEKSFPSEVSLAASRRHSRQDLYRKATLFDYEVPWEI